MICILLSRLPGKTRATELRAIQFTTLHKRLTKEDELVALTQKENNEESEAILVL
jgi:hypothetical protein